MAAAAASAASAAATGRRRRRRRNAARSKIFRDAFFGKLDGLVDDEDVVCGRQRRTIVDYERTDALASFAFRWRGTRAADGRFRPSSLGNPFAKKLRTVLVALRAAENRRREEERTNTISEYVSCLFDEESGPEVARLRFETRARGVVEHRGMHLFETCVRAMWVLLKRDGRFLEEFQLEYAQSFLLHMFKGLTGSDMNRYLHRALTLLSLGSAAVASYDPAFPDEQVAKEMSAILEGLGKRVLVLVGPRRSGKSLVIDVMLSLFSAFALRDVYVLLAANVLQAATLHIHPVRRHLEALKEEGFLPVGAKISSNDAEVSLAIYDGEFLQRRSTFHVISGAPDVSGIVSISPFFSFFLSFFLSFSLSFFLEERLASPRIAPPRFIWVF